MANEWFIGKNGKTLDNLKLRFSYGSVGNQTISPYQ